MVGDAKVVDLRRRADPLKLVVHSGYDLQCCGVGMAGNDQFDDPAVIGLDRYEIARAVDGQKWRGEC